MSVKEFLKTNDTLRRIVKKLKIYKEYLSDASDYSKYYLEMAEKYGNMNYRVMLLIHSLEKGMCMPNSRPFGQKKAVDLMNVLNSYSTHNVFEYKLGISTLHAWVAFFDEHEWKNDKTCEQIRAYLADKTSEFEAGYKMYPDPKVILAEGNFEKVLLSRHSVRDFQDREIEKEDLEFALKCFVEAPTACNRQMCKIYQVKNPEVKKLLHKTVMGVGGFNHDTMTYFIVTYDMAAFDFFGERNQGYMNAGLVAMNFVNGLHFRGIGSCFMQWANKRSEDLAVRKALGILDSEKIAIVIGAGYYTEESIIPCSCRRSIEDVLRVV